MISLHLIFDCDGVLVDSEPLSMQLDVEILAEHGIAITAAEAHERFIGKTFAAMLDEISTQYKIRFPTDISIQKDLRLLALFERELRAVAGVEDTLRQIGHQRYSIASNSPAERVAASLRIAGLTPYFGDRITTFEHVPRPKPEPDVYVEAASRAGYRPEHCIVIEDSVTGVTSARRAGCTVLGFTGTYASHEQQAQKLLAAGAAATFSQMSALPRLVRAYMEAA